MDGVAYTPPGQLVMTSNWYFRIAWKEEKDRISSGEPSIAWRTMYTHLGAVHDDTRPLGCHRILMHIARDTVIRRGRMKQEGAPASSQQRLRFLGSNEPRPKAKKDPKFALTSSLPELGNQTARSRTQPVRGTGRGTNRGSSRRASRAGVGLPGPRAPRCLFESRVPESRIRSERVSALLAETSVVPFDERRLRTLRVP